VVVTALALDGFGDEAGDVVRPWKAFCRCSTFVPRARSLPRASFHRLFQSKATLSAFSTASPPPSMKKRCGSRGSPSTRAKVSTKRAIGTV
jgi:hypothetical protein